MNTGFLPICCAFAVGRWAVVIQTIIVRRHQNLHTPTLKQRALLLFEYDWDATGFAGLANDFEMTREGFDLFEFPDNARLLWFNIESFVDRLIAQHKAAPVAAVVSNHEQFGALAAALYAQKTGLVGPSPASIVACQHKLMMRECLEKVAPQANIAYRVLDCAIGDKAPLLTDFPRFIKPIKAAYSVLARNCNSQQDLDDLIRFSWHEAFVINKLVAPFERISHALFPHLPSAHQMVIEEAVHGEQFNLDGYVYQGKAHLLGVVDELMYPGTQAFMRFHYPSSLPSTVQNEALAIAQALLTEVGFDNAFFNMEFFYDRATKRLSVIEFNPRLGSQLADLYRRVDGVDVYRMQMALALGQDPASVPKVSTEFNCAASFVFRRFDHSPAPTALTAQHKTQLAAQFPSSDLIEFRKSGVGLAREYKWLGSHRYGVLHLEGRDLQDLKTRYAQACGVLDWPVGPQWEPIL